MDPFALFAAVIIVVLVVVIPVYVLSQDARSKRQDPGYRSDRRDRNPVR